MHKTQPLWNLDGGTQRREQRHTIKEFTNGLVEKGHEKKYLASECILLGKGHITEEVAAYLWKGWKNWEGTLGLSTSGQLLPTLPKEKA